jgi:hypothetical protein
VPVRSLVLAAACALLLAAPAGGSSSVRYGIQDDAWLEHGPGTLAERVATLKRLGLDVVRVNLEWNAIERRRGARDWARADALLGALRDGGIEPAVTLLGTPRWANGGRSPNWAPLRGADFARFAAAAAARYPFVSRWVIWNEPNQRRWLRPTTPAAYVTRLLNPGYAAIRRVLPAARVAGGATAPRGGYLGVSPVDFIRGMGRAGARLDAFAHHPYPLTPTETPSAGGCSHCQTITMATLERLIGEVDAAFGRTTRIWLTEYGYQTSPPDRVLGVPLAVQARYVAEAALRVRRAPRVDLLIHYLFQDEPDTARWQSGLRTADGREKPALRAAMLPLVQVARSGGRTTLWGQVRPGRGRRAYELQLHAGGVWRTLGGAARTSRRGELTRTVPAGKGARLRLFYPGAGLASPVLVVR